MYIETLDILNFRNIAQASLSLSPGFNVFYGANAQGKSNLLEAIYTLSFLKGFRASGLSDLIAFHSPKSQLSAKVKNGNSSTRLSLELDTKCRHAYLDGAPCGRARDYLGNLRAILFVPSDVTFLQEPPATRRTLMDRMVFNLRPTYLLDLEQYTRISKQKSAVLHTQEPDCSLLDVYDSQIEPYAIRLLEARYDYFNLLAPYIRRVFASIFDQEFECVLTYKPATSHERIVFGSGKVPPRSAIVEDWREAQHNAREKEILRQQMAPGPHRDDWSILLNGRSAKSFASQGQQRAVSLAIKMAEIACLRDEADVEPVFLLDDVSSELDPVRHKRLFEYLNGLTAQTFLTTTAREHVHIDSVGSMFHVENGRIEHVNG